MRVMSAGLDSKDDTRQRWRPFGQNMAKSPRLDGLFDLVERQISKPYTIERGIPDQIDRVCDKRSVNAHARLPSPL